MAIADRHREELMRLPGIYFIGVGDGGLILGVTIPSKDRTIDPEALSRVTTNLPSVIEGLPVNVKPLPILSPPSGVIILRPQGVREQADSCPQEFTEVKILSWRFCVNPSNPESIPPLMEPPIAGIPYEKAVAILERHREDLLKLPGVQGVGLGNEGISVWTNNSDVLPPQIEGLPVIADSPPGPLVGASHTLTTQVRPLHEEWLQRTTLELLGRLPV